MTDVDVDGEVDAGWKSYFDPEEHGNTVDVVDSEGNGSVSNSEIPNHINPEELTDKQLAIIKSAARFPNYGINRIAKTVGTSKSYSYNVIQEHWSDRIQDQPDNLPDSSIPEEHCNAIRRGLLEGLTTREFEVSRRTVSKHAKGDCDHDPETPALSYDKSLQEWQISAPEQSEGSSEKDEDPEPVLDDQPIQHQPSEGHSQGTSTAVEVGITAVLLLIIASAFWTAWRVLKAGYGMVKR